jgi:hypothetical protein
MRFKVMSIENAKAVEGINDPDYLIEDYDPYYDYGDVLVDTHTRTVVWKDGMEPEDAILRRDLGWFVDQMNALVETGGDD